MDIAFFIFDIETTINNHPVIRSQRTTDHIGEKKGWSDYFVPENNVIQYGIKEFPLGTPEASIHFISTFHKIINTILYTDKYVALVGINLGFDLSYFIPHYYNYLSMYFRDDPEQIEPTFKETFSRLLAWDLQLIEYLISGHDTKFASMKDLCEIHTIKREDKDTILREYWSKGINTTDIPINELKLYLLEDLETTLKIFKAQYTSIKELVNENPNFSNLLVDNLKGRVATACMQLQPFELGLSALINESEYYEERADFQEEMIETYTWKLITEENLIPEHPSQDILKYNSIPSMVRFALGEELTLSYKVPYMEDGKVVRFKSGSRKGEVVLKTQKKTIKLPVEKNFLAGRSFKTTSMGTISLDEDTVEEMLQTIPSALSTTRTILLEYKANKKTQKILSTYIEGLISNAGYSRGIYTKAKEGSIVLPTTYNHCATATGRLSSSKPNLQNLT